MKNIYTLIASIVVLIIIALGVPKSCNEPELVNNTYELQQIDSLVAANDSIKAFGEVLELKLTEAKKRKDSIVYVTKNHYIMAYDTITKDSVECLPKPYVDSLSEAFEYVLEQSDSVIAIKSIQINNLEQQNNLKDTIILSHKSQVNELQKTIKKEKRNKFLFGIGGFISGVIVGKL